MKKGRHYELPVTTIQKLEAYEISSHIKKNKIVELAIEDYIIKEVDVENLTQEEVNTRWSAVNEKIHQFKMLEQKLLARLGD